MIKWATRCVEMKKIKETIAHILISEFYTDYKG
jgi:hypothetical protein